MLEFLGLLRGQVRMGVLASKLPDGYFSLCLKALACDSEPLLHLRKKISQELLGRL
ncbi:hypothetical protein NHP190012_11620 [Helicobacter sp. NHP19-012]|uniref:Uncharacterized protein n=1 Tax=Helicobacter gastrofelis TaxID=2849642 RepID=A0ABM7SPG8_9HELI|nr:hypothetical protein [Helicobacter sp. NHP19-012]BCZ19520.1 hypothetical protein NHP190012_11620 [Helicobacter sp. NHP19-012]